jgi:hypothetical protein
VVLRIEVASVPTISNNVLQFLVSVLHLSNTFLIAAIFEYQFQSVVPIIN